MKVCYFDTETTGLDSIKNDIIQIAGIIEIDKKVEHEFVFTCQPFSYENISQEALDVHGMSVDDIKEFDKPQVVYKNLINLFSQYINRYDRNDKFYPAGQNVRFDIDFLRQFFIKNRDKYYGSWFNYHAIDLISLSAILEYTGSISVNNLKLETIAEYFGYEFKAHDALEDIKMTRKLIREIIEKYIKT